MGFISYRKSKTVEDGKEGAGRQNNCGLLSCIFGCEIALYYLTEWVFVLFSDIVFRFRLPAVHYSSD